MKFFLVLVSMSFVSAAHGNFSRGDAFQYVNIAGSLKVVCENQTQVVACQDIFMEPWPYDIFIGAKNPAAESVQINARSKNDSQKLTVDYYGRIGKSADINLGVSSLFQKPLLKLGENKIQYVLLDKVGNTLDSNIFVVTVTRGQSRRCVESEILSLNSEDCDHPYTLCQKYFRKNNYCR
jgi:hypothetical protein